MLGSIILVSSVITRTTATGHTSRSRARVPTRPTTVSSTHSSWCCQAVGDTAMAAHPVMPTARSSWPSRA